MGESLTWPQRLSLGVGEGGSGIGLKRSSGHANTKIKKRYKIRKRSALALSNWGKNMLVKIQTKKAVNWEERKLKLKQNLNAKKI